MNNSKSVNQLLEFLKIFSNRERAFLECGKLITNLHNPSFGLRREHALKCEPNIMSSRKTNNVGHKRLGKRGDNGGQDNLILLDPLSISRIRKQRSFTNLGYLWDHLGWSRGSAINIAKEVLATKVRNQLGFPQKIVIMVEFDGDNMMKVDKARGKGWRI